MTEEIEDLLVLMGKHLTKLSRYSNQENKINNNGKVITLRN